MENKKHIFPMPLSMNRNEKLKVFAVLSKHNEIPHEILNNKLCLSIVFSYTPAEAIMGAIEGLQMMGRNSQEYQTPYMLISKELDGVIKLPTKIEFPIKDENVKIKTIEARKIETRNNDAIISYVRFVFDRVGTPTQKKTAEAVILKFQEYAKSFIKK